MIILIFKIILATTNFITTLFANEQKTDTQVVQKALKEPVVKIELVDEAIVSSNLKNCKILK